MTAVALIGNSYCRSSAAVKIEFFLRLGVIQHENEDGSPCDYGGRSGGENLALYPKGTTLDEVVDAWMQSPHHREVIMTKDFLYAGYASGIYPESTTKLIMGPGQFNPDTGAYTTEPYEYTIPEALRGKLVCYCLRMTATE